MTWCEFRDCPFNGPTIEFVDFMRGHAIEFPDRGSIGCCNLPASPRSHSRGVAVDGYKHPLRPQCDAIAAWLTLARNRMILIHNE